MGFVELWVHLWSSRLSPQLTEGPWAQGRWPGGSEGVGIVLGQSESRQQGSPLSPGHSTSGEMR